MKNKDQNPPVASEWSRPGALWRVLSGVLLFGCCALLALGAGKKGPPIEITFLDAGAGAATKPVSGWPLTLSLVVDGEQLQGIGLLPHHSGLVGERSRGARVLAFDDPDGCPSWVGPAFQEEHVVALRDGLPPRKELEGCTVPPPLPWPVDEGLLVSPGLNTAFGGLVAQEANATDGRPWVRTFNVSSQANDQLESVGPMVGTSFDHYGYGANAYLPGLVLLADRGPGVVFDPDFTGPSRLTVRNLAGFFDSVALELKNSRGRVEVRAHMIVPAGLFTPVMLIDQDLASPCRGDAGSGHELVRLDGGPPQCGLPGGALGFHSARSMLGALPVTLRAFVVRGEAPALLEDQDGNGVVDLADARATGLEPLSGQAELRFHHYTLESFLREWTPLPHDIDGNGDVGWSDETPITGSPATLVDPPP